MRQKIDVFEPSQEGGESWKSYKNLRCGDNHPAQVCICGETSIIVVYSRSYDWKYQFSVKWAPKIPLICPVWRAKKKIKDFRSL